MKEYKRISDAEVFKILDNLENEKELSMKEMYNAQMLLLLDIRHFLRKIYKNKNTTNNIVTNPLDAEKDDIVIGKGE